MDSSYNDKEKLIWLNGKLVGELGASVSVFDHGLLTGDGVFETLIAYDHNQRESMLFGLPPRLSR